MRWDGRTVVCIASGPSLTREDCELVRESGYPTIVTNTTFRMCPWANILFGFDARWWKHYRDEVASFRGERLSSSMVAVNYGATVVSLGYRNSGACAVALAMSRGASRVVMLAYDADLGPDGETHHHGSHPPELSNAESMGDWPEQFLRLAKVARRRGVTILNASRRTSLTCFPLVALEDALREEQTA